MRDDLPTGTVTFLFTDVEGSTKLLQEIGDEAYDAALAEHRRIVRAACAKQGGVEVDTQGDAFFFVFPTAPGALGAASAVTRALAPGPIQVRIGLHTGRPRVTGEGYVGKEVHFAARVAATGHGGQIVLSKATAELVDAELTELGEHRLKDVPEAVPIFQVGRESFPPLRTISNTNLPRPASSFVGRQREQAEVMRELQRGTRLLTLTGAGGSGKTRLALEAAAELVPSYKAGVFWVGLAALREPSLVTEAIAQTLGARGELAEYVGEREMLLLLDNLEQVIEAAPALSALVATCPNLALLVTSRELLRVQGEVEYPVPPLASSEAVSLFCERSRLEATDEIAELCSRLDDLPLAVELAAARTKALSPAQIFDRLSQRLDLLRGGRDAETRQRTLRATIEWSYDLLTQDEQRLFLALSIFAGGCTLAAAEEVAGADLETLQSLVEKSLVRFTQERYWMLATIREYASERLEDAHEAREVRERHADYFLAFAQREGPLLETAAQHDARAHIVIEESNLRLALEHFSREHPERLLEFVSGLTLYWTSAGRMMEIQHWAKLALENGSSEPTALRADALLVLGVIASRVGDRSSSIETTREAIEIYRDRRSPRLGRALVYLGSSYLRSGRYEEARSALEDALEHAATSADDWARTLAVSNLGYLSLILGDYERAERLSLEAVELKRKLGNEVGIAEAMCNAGLAALLANRIDKARELLGETARISLSLGHATLLACCLEGYAWMAATSDDPKTAAILQGAADTQMESVGGGLDGVEQRIHDETQALVTSSLGHDWEHYGGVGRALNADEAIAYASGPHGTSPSRPSRP